MEFHGQLFITISGFQIASSYGSICSNTNLILRELRISWKDTIRAYQWSTLLLHPVTEQSRMPDSPTQRGRKSLVKAVLCSCTVQQYNQLIQLSPDSFSLFGQESLVHETSHREGRWGKTFTGASTCSEVTVRACVQHFVCLCNNSLFTCYRLLNSKKIMNVPIVHVCETMNKCLKQQIIWLPCMCVQYSCFLAIG